jgi:hypothetical protein
MLMPSEPPSALLDRVRKLLAKAEAEGVTPPEAEALTAKAAELMARYGIDRARLAASRPDTDRPGSRCQCVLLSTSGPGARIHVFGYVSDLERADILYTSLLLQMARGLTAAVVPDGVRSVRAWRRSWLLGFVTAVITRVRSAEERAAASVDGEPASGPSTALVLADRAVVIRRQVEQAYPVTRKTRITYSGRGYSAGYAQGQRADIGNARLGRNKALNRA